MDKSEEVDTLKRFVESLPRDSYLWDFMSGSIGSFAAQVANDVTYPALANIWADRAAEARAAEQEAKACRKQLDALRRECDQIGRTVARKRDELDEIRRIANRLAACN